MTIKIPVGVQEGTTLKISGAGEAGSRGGPSGDLYVIIHQQEDPRFHRDEETILVEQKISMTQAVLGANLEVPAVDGSVTLKIPAGTQHGTTFRVKERGMPYLGGSRGRGDHLVKVFVEIPSKLTDKHRYRDWETDRKSTRLNSSHEIPSRMPSSA